MSPYAYAYPIWASEQGKVYINDLLVLSETLEERFKVLEEVAKRLTDAGLTININKSEFVLKEFMYLWR